MDDTHYDACIVGCGIIGSTIALSLALRGKKILVVEHEAVPLRGSTLAGFGALTPYSDPYYVGDTALFAAKSLEIYQKFWLSELFKLTGRNVPLSSAGLLQLFSKKEKMEREIQRYESDCIPGYRPQILNKASLQNIEPAINKVFEGALRHPEPWIDLDLYVGALEVALAASSGIDLCTNCTVRDIDRLDSGTLDLSLTSDRKFRCEFLVVCTGLNVLERQNLKTFPMEWVRGDGIALRSPNNIPLFKNNIYASPGFIAPRATGEMLLGSTYVKEGVKPSGSPIPDRETISFESLEKISSACQLISADLKDCSVERVWRGWRPCSADERPIFGPDPKNPNIVYALGFLGLGITLSVAVGDSVAEYVTSGRADFPESMNPGRFPSGS